jgi:hypothetical protein
MSNRFDRSSHLSRAALSLGLAGVAVVAMAARSQTTPQPPAKPAAAATTPAPMPAMPMPAASAPRDSQTSSAAVPADSLAAKMSMPMSAPVAPIAAAAPKPTGPAKWPVDAAGRTLVNGTPVVGRVFTQQKVDGLVKYAYSKVYVGEPPHPAAPIINARHNTPPITHARRFRGMMVEATLWSIDNKRSARELRYYRPSTEASRLRQR